MKKYTITDQEWESVLDKVHTLEKENSHLKGVIDGLERALTLTDVSQQRELLEGFVDWFNINDKTQAILSERIEEYLKTL